MTDAVRILEEALDEAEQLIRRRLAERGIEIIPYLVMAAMPDSEMILRSNIRPEALRSFGEELIDVAGEMARPPGPEHNAH